MRRTLSDDGSQTSVQAPGLAADHVAQLQAHARHSAQHLGESLKTAQAQLGHAPLSTTAEIYTHVVAASQRAAVEKLETVIWTQVDPNGPSLEKSREGRISK